MASRPAFSGPNAVTGADHSRSVSAKVRDIDSTGCVRMLQVSADVEVLTIARRSQVGGRTWEPDMKKGTTGWSPVFLLHVDSAAQASAIVAVPQFSHPGSVVDPVPLIGRRWRRRLTADSEILSGVPFDGELVEDAAVAPF